MGKKSAKLPNKWTITTQEEWTLAAKQRAFRTMDASDFIIEAIHKAEMDKRHNQLNKFMK